MSVFSNFRNVCIVSGVLVGMGGMAEAVPFTLSQNFDDPTLTRNGNFGNSVSIFSDNVLIGTQSGQAHLFSASTGALLQTFDDPTPNGPRDGNFGNSVSIFSDSVLIGGFRDDTNGPNVGQAHLFSASTGALLQTFDDPTPTPTSNGNFGNSVSIFGDNVLIGAFFDDTNGTSVGQAHLFSASTGALLQTFDDPTPTNQDRFGNSVSIFGDSVLIGALRDDTNGTNAGQAHLFSASTGALLQTFDDPTPASLDEFGSSVSISGDSVLIGAFFDDTNGANVGQAHLFSASTGALLQTFDDPTPTDFDFFGLSVSISGDNVLIGALGDSTNGTSVGQAHLFSASTGALLQTFDDPTPTDFDRFGNSVSISGDSVLIGARSDDTSGRDVGQVHLFTVDATQEPPALPPEVIAQAEAIIADRSTNPGASEVFIGPVEPNRPTIIVTHGWQPNRAGILGDFENDPFPLEDTTAAIIDELNARNVGFNILEVSWEGANTLNPLSAKSKTNGVGDFLANYLDDFLPDDYSENLHFIGHSYGALVNAFAIDRMGELAGTQDLVIDQVTLLDAPEKLRTTQVGGLLAGPVGFAAGINYNLFDELLDPARVGYVDNYFSSNTITDLLSFDIPGLGGTLPGSAPNDGVDVNPFYEPGSLGVGHNKIHSDFYNDWIEEAGDAPGTADFRDQHGDWISAADPGTFSDRRGPVSWSPEPGLLSQIATTVAELGESAWQLAIGTAETLTEIAFDATIAVGNTVIAAGTLIVDSTGAVVDFVSDSAVTVSEAIIDVGEGTAEIVFDTVNGIVSVPGIVARSLLGLFENSPTVVVQEIEIPTGSELLKILIDIINSGDGDWITVHFDSELIYSAFIDEELKDIGDVTIPISSFAGQTGTFFVTLNSVGEANAQVAFGDFRFLGNSPNSQTSVPEPGMLVLFGLGLAGLCFVRRRKAT